MTIPKGLRSEPAILAILSLVLLLPFLNKAAHIDDPCYIWAAQQIVSSPMDYYGFSVNWYGREMQMYEVNQNPPLLSYYLAIFGGLFGWREWILHLGLIPVAFCAALGVWRLADSTVINI